MKELFNKVTISIIASSVAAFIIGLVMVLVPNMSLQIMGSLFGAYIVIHGIVLIIMDFMAHNIYIPFYGIISGLLSIIVGIVLISMPGILSTVFTIALGIWIILSSANLISISISVKDFVAQWYLWLILGIVDMICGIIILFNPFASSISIAVLTGIILMVHAVITLVDTVMIRNDAKNVAKAFQTKIKELS